MTAFTDMGVLAHALQTVVERPEMRGLLITSVLAVSDRVEAAFGADPSNPLRLPLCHVADAVLNVLRHPGDDLVYDAADAAVAAFTAAVRENGADR